MTDHFTFDTTPQLNDVMKYTDKMAVTKSNAAESYSKNKMRIMLLYHTTQKNEEAQKKYYFCSFQNRYLLFIKPIFNKVMP